MTRSGIERLPTSTAQLRRLVPLLEDLEFGMVCRSILGVHESAGTVDTGGHLTLLFWEWLVHLGFVSDRRRALLHGALRARLDALAAALDGGGAVPILTVTIADRRWACWTGHDAFLDLAYHETHAELPEPAVTLIVCNVTALYRRACLRFAGATATEPGRRS